MNFTPQTRFGHFEIIKPLGKGGMGEVYLAEDKRLERDVAIKFLNPEFAQDENKLNRFIQEAKAASALNHPNILTVYEIGETDNIHFIATEFVDGKTLRSLMRHGSLPISKLLDIAIQTAEALATAHSAGIVHRDVKPENIMIRQDGYVKVLDFGLAKLLEREEFTKKSKHLSEKNVKTTPGMIMGTTAYMSPEQARATAVDERSDVWSLGIVLFEALTGSVPFQGETMSDVIAAVIHEEVPPLRDFIERFPEGLEKIIKKSLRKIPEERYQNMKDFAIDLGILRRHLNLEMELGQGIAPDMAETVMMPVPDTSVLSNFPSTSGGSKDRLLITEFTNLTDDDVFDGALKTALAVSLEQSPFLDIFPDTQTRKTLQLMGRSAEEKVTPELGREICQRKGMKAYITGTISGLGSHYVLTLEAVNAQTGEAIGRQLAQAESKEDVLKALGQAASGLREKLGENLSSIGQFDAQFDYTTSSLTALKVYSLGVEQQRKGNFLEAIRFYQQAIELDPNFSSAYVASSSCYANTNQPKLAAEYAEKAFELRDKVSELEKLRIQHFYYAYFTGEIYKRIETLELMKRTFPRVKTTLNNLADCYMQIGKFEKAVDTIRHTLKMNPDTAVGNFAVSYDNLALSFIHLNQFEEAKSVCERAIDHNLDNVYFREYLYKIAFIENDEKALEENLKWIQENAEEYILLNLKTETAAFRGQWRKSQDYSRRAVETAISKEVRGVAGSYAADQALRIVFWSSGKGLPTAENKKISLAINALSRKALEFERNQVNLSRTALALALSGQKSQTQDLINEMKEKYPKDTFINNLWIPLIKASLCLQEQKAEEAIELLESVKRYEPVAEFYSQYVRGTAFLRLGENENAAEEFTKIINKRGESPLSTLYSLAHLGLARATQEAKHYKKFFELWEDADTDMPALVEAKKEFKNL